jgi:hypothetical protein
MNVAKAAHTIRETIFNPQIQAKQQTQGALVAQIEAEVVVLLQELVSDPDDDVKYYARRAINLIK